MSKLDKNCTEPGYLFGRLFCVLELTQAKASGGGSVERTFGVALASPNQIFPRLLSRAKSAHLPKLKRDNTGLFCKIESMIQEIENKFNAKSLPASLEPEQQGLFLLGYYHQKEDWFERKVISHDEADSSSSEPMETEPELSERS